MNIKLAIRDCMLEAGHIRSANTRRAYENGLNCFIAYLSSINIKLDHPAEAITIQHLIDYLPWLGKREYTKGTLRVYVSAVKYFEEWLVTRDILRPDYNDGVRFDKAARNLMRRRERRFPRIPAKDNDNQMVHAVHQLIEDSPRRERNIALIEFLFSSGCRANEVANLRICDIDMSERSAVVVGKGDKERRVFFSREAKDALARYFTVRGHQNPLEPVFCRHDRGASRKILPITTATIRNVVWEIAKAAGIDMHLFTPHSFRHAFAIRMLRSTRNLALVQDLLGHADPAATRVYATIYPDELRDAHREVFD